MKSIKEMVIGQTSEITRNFSDKDVDLFSLLSGDVNPVHLDEAFAKTTIFGGRIVHGALLTSIFSTIFANNLPGPGCIYLKSENKFLKPVFLNEAVNFKVEITNKKKKKKRVVFKTTAVFRNQECIVGTAELYIPE